MTLLIIFCSECTNSSHQMTYLGLWSSNDQWCILHVDVDIWSRCMVYQGRHWCWNWSWYWNTDVEVKVEVEVEVGFYIQNELWMIELILSDVGTGVGVKV